MGNQQQLAARQFGPGAAKRQRQVKSAATKEFKPLRKSLERKQKEILDVTAALQSSTCLDTPLALQGMVQHLQVLFLSGCEAMEMRLFLQVVIFHMTCTCRFPTTSCEKTTLFLQRLGCEAEALIYQAEEALAMEEIPVLEELVFPTPAPPSEAPLRLEPPPTPSADPLEVPSVGTAQPKGIREVVGVAPSVCEEEGDAEMRPRLLGLEPSVGSSPLSGSPLLPPSNQQSKVERTRSCQEKWCCSCKELTIPQLTQMAIPHPPDAQVVMGSQWPASTLFPVWPRSYTSHHRTARTTQSEGCVYPFHWSREGLGILWPPITLILIRTRLNSITVHTPFSGVPRFPIKRSANSDSPLKRHDLYGRQQLRRRCRAPLKGDSPLNGTPLKGVYTVPS